VAQPTRLPTISAPAANPLRRPVALEATPFPNHPNSLSLLVMTLLLLEALGALLLLVFIVWWTMFSGRKKGELPDEAEQEKREGGAKRKD
jgi:hypothetical protein